MPEQGKKPGGLLANLGFNIIIPTLILTKLSSAEYLGPSMAVVVALAFPIGYGLKDFVQTRKPNFFSILGVISVVLTGGIALLELDPKYIAIKEAAIPGLIGLATLFSVRTRFPLVRTFLYNDQILRTDLVAQRLEERGNTAAFERMLANATYLVAASFFLSSVLNYLLAKFILVSPPGTEAFTAELGKMTALSYPVIALPSSLVLFCALFYLMRGIGKLTGGELEDFLNT